MPGFTQPLHRGVPCPGLIDDAGRVWWVGQTVQLPAGSYLDNDAFCVHRKYRGGPGRIVGLRATEQLVAYLEVRPHGTDYVLQVLPEDL